jgi:hypothetical protein
VTQPRESKGISRRPKILDLLGAGPMSEGDARDIAERVVRTSRSSRGRIVEGPAPEPDEVRERREARISRESHQDT